VKKGLQVKQNQGLYENIYPHCVENF